MTKSTITREQAQKIIVAADEVITALAGTNEDVHPDDSKKMCELWDDLNDRHAPPAMDSKPVAWTDEQELRDVDRGGCGYLFTVNPVTPHADERRIILLYRHAQQPVVPDDVLDALQKVARIRLDMDGFDGDRRGIADCLCDAEEALIEVVTRRAAMFNHPEQHLDMVDHSGDVNEKGGDGNSPVIPDGWTCNDKANAALMMLDRIETVAPVDDDRIDGIKRIVRELAAAPHDTPALNSIQSVDTVADRWIPVSERMPEVGDIVLTAMGGAVNVGEMECSAANCRFFTSVISGRELPATHWMPLPAAPQEVKP